MRIALDAMGSDSHPRPEVEGAILAAREFSCDVILTGDETMLRLEIERLQAQDVSQKLHIVHTPQQVDMNEAPAFASRRKSDNSMSRGLQLVRDQEADAFVTAGNTGAALTNALLVLGRIRGAKRPALTAVVPVRNGRCVMIDIGANAECKPEYLYQFGIMGSVYAEKVLGIEKPRVGLLSTGEEPGKGNVLTQQTYDMLQESRALNFVGNVEGQQIFAGAADVVVADGFTGNIAIKITEAVAAMMGSMIKRALMSSPLAMLGGILARAAIKRVERQLDPNEYGGAPLLGINGIAIVGHGRSNGRAIRSAIKVALTAHNQEMLDEIQRVLSQRLSDL